MNCPMMNAYVHIRSILYSFSVSTEKSLAFVVAMVLSVAAAQLVDFDLDMTEKTDEMKLGTHVVA